MNFIDNLKNRNQNHKELVAKSFSEIASFISGELAIKKYQHNIEFKNKTFAFAITERGTLDTIESFGKIKDNNIYIKGSKKYITNGSVADFFLTLIKINNKPTLIYIPKDKINIDPIYKICFKSISMAHINFDTNINKDFILGEVGQGSQIFNFLISHERVLTSLIYLNRINYLKDYLKDSLAKKNLLNKINLQEIESELDQLNKEINIHLKYLDNLNFNNFKKIAKFKIYASNLNFKLTSQIMEYLGGEAFINLDLDEELNNALASKIYSGSNGVLNKICE